MQAHALGWGRQGRTKRVQHGVSECIQWRWYEEEECTYSFIRSVSLRFPGDAMMGAQPEEERGECLWGEEVGAKRRCGLGTIGGAERSGAVKDVEGAQNGQGRAVALGEGEWQLCKRQFRSTIKQVPSQRMSGSCCTCHLNASRPMHRRQVPPLHCCCITARPLSYPIVQCIRLFYPPSPRDRCVNPHLPFTSHSPSSSCPLSSPSTLPFTSFFCNVALSPSPLFPFALLPVSPFPSPHSLLPQSTKPLAFLSIPSSRTPQSSTTYHPPPLQSDEPLSINEPAFRSAHPATPCPSVCPAPWSFHCVPLDSI